MQEQFDSSTVNDSSDSQRVGTILSFSDKDDANDDSQEEEHLCKHCGSVVPLGSVLCPDCGCWWSK